MCMQFNLATMNSDRDFGETDVAKHDMSPPAGHVESLRTAIGTRALL